PKRPRQQSPHRGWFGRAAFRPPSHSLRRTRTESKPPSGTGPVGTPAPSRTELNGRRVFVVFASEGSMVLKVNPVPQVAPHPTRVRSLPGRRKAMTRRLAFVPALLILTLPAARGRAEPDNKQAVELDAAIARGKSSMYQAGYTYGTKVGGAFTNLTPEN